MVGRWRKPRQPPGAKGCSLVSTRYAVLIALAQCRPASVMGNSHCGNILDSAWATIHDGSGDICSAHPFLFSVSLSQVRGWWLQLRMACRRLSASRRGARDAQGGRLAQLGVGAAAAVQIVRVLRSGGAEARSPGARSPGARSPGARSRARSRACLPCRTPCAHVCHSHACRAHTHARRLPCARSARASSVHARSSH